jgi:hypothetical protein
LHPDIVFSGDKHPSDSDVESLNHRSHEECFIANSVLTEVTTAKMPLRVGESCNLRLCAALVARMQPVRLARAVPRCDIDSRCERHHSALIQY